MKKLLICILFLFAGAAYAEDYAYQAVDIYNKCIRRGEDCEKVIPITNKGIAYYAPRKNNSYEDRKRYCTVLGIRFHYKFHTNSQTASQDMMNFQMECSMF